MPSSNFLFLDKTRLCVKEQFGISQSSHVERVMLVENVEIFSLPLESPGS